MAKFKERIPELLSEYERMTQLYEQQVEDLWAEMRDEFAMKNGLTDKQVDKIEEGVR